MKLSAYRHYWNEDYRIGVVANQMPVKLFEKLCCYIHFCGNTNIRTENNYSKVLLVLNALRSNLMKMESKKDYSINEAMIPYKGKKLEIYSITSKTNQKNGNKIF